MLGKIRKEKFYEEQCIWCLYSSQSVFLMSRTMPFQEIERFSQFYQDTNNTQHCISLPTFSSVQSLSLVRLFATPLIAALQASLSITNSRSSLKLMSIKSVMPSSHLILWRPLLLLPPIPPSIRVFSNESTLRTRWPKYWSFSFSIILPKNTQD